MHLSTPHLPLVDCVELAQGRGLPWALWAVSSLGQERFVLCLGGEPSPAEEGWASTALEPRRAACADDLHLAEVVRALPDRLAAWRFDPLRGEVDVGWEAWGRAGWRWSPALTLAFDSPAGEVSERALLLWLRSAPCVAACAWSEEGAWLWTQLDELYRALTAGAGFREALLTPASPASSGGTAEEGEPFEAWRERVRDVVARCEEGALEKVVLAREVRMTAGGGEAWDALSTWCACQVEAQRASCAYALSLRPESTLVGLTPERLIESSGALFKTHALAGTRAIKDADALSALERDLMSSTKDQREHALVVEELMSRLAPYALTKEALPRRVRRLKTLLHLETPVEGTLAPEVDPLTLVEALHPTPALGGAPSARALAHLRETESLARGGYAAPWCWLNRAGELSAQVVIRSALLSPHEARLFAGAGVVSGSSPEAEWRETEDKLMAIKRQLRSRLTTAQRPGLNVSASLALLRGLQLSSGGLAGVVISPGSRSTPLALVADTLLRSVVIIDERMAAFYALGWAREAGAPVALICTSGSAGAHYLPALIEARHAGVPLIALTADRPDHVQGLGAPQTIDQRALFGTFVKKAWPLLTPQRLEDATAWSSVGYEAGALSVEHPHGPVHVNAPFEEPLWSPELDEALRALRALSAQGGTPALCEVSEASPPPKRAASAPRRALPHALLSEERGLIYCGPLTARCAALIAPLISELSERLGWPVWAEASSQLRSYGPLRERLICWGERSARQQALPDPAALDALLLVGAPPHARAVSRWLSAWGERARARELSDGELVAAGSVQGWRRPMSVARCVLLGERPEPSNPLLLPCAWCEEEPSSALRGWLNAKGHAQGASLSVRSSGWLSAWRARDHAADPHRGDAPLKAHGSLWGGSIGALLSRALEQRAQAVTSSTPHLHIASSTAFRDLDMTLSSEAEVRVHSQRGANGIDGTLAAALGSLNSTPTDAPLLLWIGDTAAHHDLASLIAWGADPVHATRLAPSTILLVNNGGGGIFGLLPIRGADRFETLFKAPIQDRQQITWETLASHAGFTYERHDSAEGLTVALHQALSPCPEQPRPPHLIELIVEPQHDLEQRRAYWSGGVACETQP